MPYISNLNSSVYICSPHMSKLLMSYTLLLYTSGCMSTVSLVSSLCYMGREINCSSILHNINSITKLDCPLQAFLQKYYDVITKMISRTNKPGCYPPNNVLYEEWYYPPSNVLYEDHVITLNQRTLSNSSTTKHCISLCSNI